MWVVDLIIEAQKAKQKQQTTRKEKSRWYLDIRGLLKRQRERRVKERAETKRKL
jgi:hypothetical protein